MAWQLSASALARDWLSFSNARLNKEMATLPENSNNPDFVQSLSRGLAVISAFSEDSPSMTLTEVSEKVGLTRATARRFLLTLESLGFMRSDGKNFSLTPKVMELGYSYLASQGLAGIISPHLAELSAVVHESSSAAILDGTDIVYIARTAGRKIMQVQITIGTRFPAYATSMGRVLLAGMSAEDSAHILTQAQPQLLTPHTKVALPVLTSEIALVKTQGFSFVDQELELGLRSLAVPIHNRNGNVIAALNVSTTASTPVDQTLSSLLAPLKKCAESIEYDLSLTA